MKYITALITLLIAGSPAYARHHHHARYTHHYRHYRSFADGRPHAWCGWYMRQRLGVRDPSYNLARNWAHFGTSAGGPHVGVVVVWPHHVGIITGGGPGGWIVTSGNDGNAVRSRRRSLAGAIAFRSI